MQFHKPKFFAAILLSLGLLGSVPAHANLVINGDFESGDFSGWTTVLNPTWDSVDGNTPQAGSFGAYFGNASISTISQTLNTVAGMTYDISFWLKAEDDVNGVAFTNYFEFDWDGLVQQTIADVDAFDYTQYNFSLLASSATTELTFQFRNTPAFWDFDSVDVEARVTVPEPNSLLLAAAGALVYAFLRRRAADAVRQSVRV